MPAERGATSLGYTIPRKRIKRERGESEISEMSSWSEVSSWHSPSSDTAGSPTVPLDTTTSYKQATADPYDAYDDPDAPISRRTRFVRFTRPHLFDKPAPLQQPIRPRPRLINNLASLQQPTLPNKPTSVRSEKAAPKRSPNLDMEFLTGRIIALTERNASLEHENEALKTLNQELKTKYEVLAEKVAGLADILRREA